MTDDDGIKIKKVKYTIKMEYIKEDIMERCKAELREHGLVIDYKITREEDYLNIRDKKLEEFLTEATVRTENERDFISSKKLWDKYEEWNIQYDRAMQNKITILSAKTFGMTMRKIGKYEKGHRTPTYGKTERGYIKLKWKTESTKAEDFMKQNTLKTIDKKEINRLKINEVLMVYYVWLDKEFPEESQRKEKIGQEEFGVRLRKAGYMTNQGYIYKEYTTEKNTIKMERISKKEAIVLNVMWLPGSIAYETILKNKVVN